jgi:cell fate regulator YaaT (PSP1 superfamily)
MMEKDLKIIGVRFSKVGKIYYFNAKHVPDLTLGDQVVVETSRGWQLGEVVLYVSDPGATPEGGWKQIERRATPRDLLQKQSWLQKENEVREFCKGEVEKKASSEYKLIDYEISFDGNRLSIFYATESSEKIDFKNLRQAIQKKFNFPQVELRQIGPRDMAKCMGGMGACGLESRCCSRFLTEFNSISIRMAKEQGISLTPSEITGICGRLRCCLFYEYNTYVSFRQQLPRRNAMVETPLGEGKVIEVYPLRQSVLIQLPDEVHKEFPKEQLKFDNSQMGGQRKQAVKERKNIEEDRLEKELDDGS